MRKSGFFVRIALAAAVSAGLGQAAMAEVSVSGSRDEIHLKASEAPLEEVLTVLRDRYGLVYRTETPLTQPVSGVYRGSLERVVSLLTRRYDHAIRTNAGTVELVFTNQVKSTAKPPPLTQPTPEGNVSAVSAALQTQAQQIALANASATAQANGSGTGASAGSIAGLGATAGSPSGNNSAAASQASMAQMTQQASSTVKELAAALSRISLPK